MTDPSNRAQFNRQKSLTSGRNHEMVPPHEMHQMGRAMRPMMSKGPPPRNYTMRPPTMKKYRGRSHIKQMMPWANWPSVYNMNQKNTELYIKAYQRGNKIEADYNPSKTSHLSYYCRKYQRCIEAHNRNPLNRVAPLMKKCKEPEFKNTAWDFLLLEMAWVATDRLQNRKHKRAKQREIAGDIELYAPHWHNPHSSERISQEISIVSRLGAVNSIFTAYSQVDSDDQAKEMVTKNTKIKSSLLNYMKRVIEDFGLEPSNSHKVLQKSKELKSEIELILERKTFQPIPLAKQVSPEISSLQEKYDPFWKEFHSYLPLLKSLQTHAIGNSQTTTNTAPPVSRTNSTPLKKRKNEKHAPIKELPPSDVKKIAHRQLKSVVPRDLRMMLPEDVEKTPTTQLERHNFLMQLEYFKNAVQFFNQEEKLELDGSALYYLNSEKPFFEQIQKLPYHVLPLNYRKFGKKNIIEKQDIKDVLRTYKLGHIDVYQFNLLRKRDHFREIKSYRREEIKEFHQVLPNLHTKYFNQLLKKMKDISKAANQGIDSVESERGLVPTIKISTGSVIRQKKSQFSKHRPEEPKENEEEDNNHIEVSLLDKGETSDTSKNKFERKPTKKKVEYHFFENYLIEWATIVYGDRWDIIEDFMSIHPLSTGLRRHPVEHYKQTMEKKNRQGYLDIPPVAQIPSQLPRLADGLPLIMTHRHLPNWGLTIFSNNLRRLERGMAPRQFFSIEQEQFEEQWNKRISIKQKATEFSQINKKDRKARLQQRYQEIAQSLEETGQTGPWLVKRKHSEAFKAPKDVPLRNQDLLVAIDLEKKSAPRLKQPESLFKIFQKLETVRPVATCKSLKRKKYERFLETDNAVERNFSSVPVPTHKLQNHIERITLATNPYLSPSMYVLKTPFINLNSSLVPKLSLSSMPKKKKRSLFGKKGMCALLAQKTKVYAIANNVKANPHTQAEERSNDLIAKFSQGDILNQKVDNLEDLLSSDTSEWLFPRLNGVSLEQTHTLEVMKKRLELEAPMHEFQNLHSKVKGRLRNFFWNHNYHWMSPICRKTRYKWEERLSLLLPLKMEKLLPPRTDEEQILTGRVSRQSSGIAERGNSMQLPLEELSQVENQEYLNDDLYDLPLQPNKFNKRVTEDL